MNHIHSASYLSKNPYSYCFRIKIPKDLLTTISRKELRYSLKTGNLSKAKTMARLLAGQIQLLFRKIRRGMNLTNEQILHMIKNYRDKLFQEYNQPVMYCQDTKSWPEDQTEIEVQYLDGKIRYTKEKVNLCDYSEVEAVVDKLLAEEGISKKEINKKSVKYSKLCSGILRSQIDSDEHDLKRLATGKFSDDIENVFKEGLSVSLALPQQDSNKEPGKPSKTISQVMDDYFKEGDTEKKWTEKTRGEVESSMNLLVEFFGDVPIDSITRAMMLEYQKALWKLPPNMTKSKKYKNKTIHEVLGMKPEETIKAHTYNKYMGRAITLFDFAVNNENMDKNPAIGLKMKINKRNADAREIFDKADLVNIFNSDQYLSDTFKKPYQFWIPVMALYTGARLNEIAQLYLSDFQQYEGVWCININEDSEDKRLKNLASNRLVPLHPFLVEDLGIIERVEKLKQKGAKRFFPELPSGRDGYGKNVSRWFNDGYKQSVGITKESGKVLNSFKI